MEPLSVLEALGKGVVVADLSIVIRRKIIKHFS